jgi:hypothetical protein
MRDTLTIFCSEKENVFQHHQNANKWPYFNSLKTEIHMPENQFWRVHRILHTFSEYSANRCLCYRKTSTIDCWLSTFPIANILYICISIPEAPSYGDYITQMEGYSRTCSSYHDVVNRGYLVTRKLLNQWYIPSL